MNLKTRLPVSVVFLSVFMGSAWSQTPVVVNVVNYGVLDGRFGPASQVIIYGSFPEGAGRDYSITVGGQTGDVSVADNTVFITAEIPTTAPLGAQKLTVNYLGVSSNTYPITISAYAPEFAQNSVEVTSATSQPVFEPSPAFTHSASGMPVTAGSPAQPGELLIASLAGLGQTNPATAGLPPPAFTPLAATPTLTVSNLAATVTQSGTQELLSQVSFLVPSNAPSGTDPVILTIGGIISNTASLPISTQSTTFFAGETSLGSGVYYLQFPDGTPFGYFNYPSSTILYHYDMGFEAFTLSGDAQSDIYLYDFTSGHWFFTSPSQFPDLYDFTLGAWIYYFPATNNPGHYSSNPRYFSNLTTGTIFKM
jgi:uncharacterized protein (TIGR03437 family)